MPGDLDAVLDRIEKDTGYRPDDPFRGEYEGWRTGEQVHVIEDDDEAGAYADDDGTLILEWVGADQYNNRRVQAGVLYRGRTDPVEVDLANLEASG